MKFIQQKEAPINKKLNHLLEDHQFLNVLELQT